MRWSQIQGVTSANPEEAVIVAVPFATEVTRAMECEVPEVEETVATDAADVDHVTLAPLIVEPFWSWIVAVSCCV
ncbi:MAG: hypothetical protein MK486_21290 [Gemmatimonadetes bacterium]|nr:hypothetical protein [Gemmatimonadota bacterium]